MHTFKVGDTILIVGSDRKISQLIQSQVGEAGSVLTIEHAELSTAKEAFFDGVFFTYSARGIITEDILRSLAKVLKPGGTFILHREESQSQSLLTNNHLLSEKELFFALTVSGFVDIKNEPVQTNGINGNVMSNTIEITASKPSWIVGASESLKIQKKAVPPSTIDKKSVWTLAANEINEEDLEDEDNLLDEDDLLKPNKKDDCEVAKNGTKKACKNCTCGRKEGISKEPTPSFNSSCGNCYLGDAFRCSGCPYLGTPAFKPGEKVELDVDKIDT